MSDKLCEIDLNVLELNEHKTDLSELPRIDSSIEYSEFFEKFLLANKPCIISNISNKWPCSKDWIENNAPNFDFLAHKYKYYGVNISNCNSRSFNAHCTESGNFIDYCNYWQKYRQNGYSNDMPLLYLKDWHLKKLTGRDFYTEPNLFSSDWLNEYFIENTDDDYRFVYMGPLGTWTPFHADVFTSFSWSVNICGKKKWILFPPGEEQFLIDNLNNLPYDVTKVQHNRKYLEIIQDAGDAIFVPSRWHHQVWNLDDTISINHNWINGCNIQYMWESLTENLCLVKNEIADCKEMDDWLLHCQLMLKTSYGIDFKMFYDFLYYIANKRIQYLINGIEIKQFGCWLLGKNHALFDLSRLKSVLEKFINHSDFDQIKFINVPPPDTLLTDIYNILENNK